MKVFLVPNKIERERWGWGKGEVWLFFLGRFQGEKPKNCGQDFF